MDWTVKDLIAILVLVGCFVLLSLGIDSYISSTITLIIGYYFGRRIDYDDLNNHSKRNVTVKIKKKK